MVVASGSDNNVFLRLSRRHFPEGNLVYIWWEVWWSPLGLTHTFSYFTSRCQPNNIIYIWSSASCAAHGGAVRNPPLLVREPTTPRMD